MRARRGQGGRGFSLIEALVSLAIAAAVITGFYGALSTGMHLNARAEAQAEAALAAAGVLDRVGVDIPLRLGTQVEGQSEAGPWRLVITDLPPRDMGAVPLSDGTLAFISVAVEGRQDVILRAVRYLQSPL